MDTKQMSNKDFKIQIDEQTGFITSIESNNDEHKMNWCSNQGFWGRIHKRDRDLGSKSFGELDGRKMEFCSAKITELDCIAEYRSDNLAVTVKRYFNDDGDFVENYKIKNISNTVVCINRDNFGIETTFNEQYAGADECMIHYCTTHIWCGCNVAWVNALKMGASDINLGLMLTRGAIDCYSVDNCHDNKRGVFILEPENILLKSGEEYEIEWVLFWHKGTEDFFEKLNKFDSYIDIKAVHYTVFENEDIEFTINSPTEQTPAVTINGENAIITETDKGYCVKYHPPRIGEYKFIVKIGEVSTWVNFLVKTNFKDLLEKRVNFIVDNQQCLDPESPLYGAFLIYDNELDSVYFDYKNSDHNACRERMNIALLLMKYLQVKDNPKVRKAIDLYFDFVFREFYEETTGEVFNNIGKNSEFLRLYNAPGAMLLFCEMYFVTREEKYLNHIVKLAEKYYSIGGEKCYANGLAIRKVVRAFRIAGRNDDLKQLMNFFGKHVDNIISIGTSYPPHECVYEQTIVTPAVTHISEMGMLCENKELYLKEAKKHMECLKRFSGMQPDCYLNEIAIRYWDGYWFGKRMMMGDTLPHHLSVLTARAYVAYGCLSGEKEWINRAEECIRNCMCLIGDDGRGSAAHIYPRTVNGKLGNFFDPWSNDQDLTLYDALYFADVAGTFEAY